MKKALMSQEKRNHNVVSDLIAVQRAIFCKMC